MHFLTFSPELQVGFKLPGGLDTRVYPTLRSLLDSCPFLNYNRSSPVQNNARTNESRIDSSQNSLHDTIQEAFPTLSKEEIVKVKRFLTIPIYFQRRFLRTAEM